MKRICILKAAIIALLFAVTGCGGEKKVTNPPNFPSVGTEWARKHRQSYSAFAPANFGQREEKAWFPDTPAEAGLVLMRLVLTVFGGWLLYHREHLGWASALLLAGLGIIAFTLTPVRVHFHLVPHAHWMWVLPLAIIWVVVKFATRTTIDDETLKIWLFLELDKICYAPFEEICVHRP